jgi:hypothetical protein
MTVYAATVVDLEGRDWDAAVRDAGDVLTLAFRCPQCRRGSACQLQPPPWRHPAAGSGHTAAAGPDGHNTAGFSTYEAERTADQLPHLDADDIDTQLWCHPCGIGAACTITLTV